MEKVVGFFLVLDGFRKMRYRLALPEFDFTAES